MDTQHPVSENDGEDTSVQAVLLAQAKRFNQRAEDMLRNIQTTVEEAQSAGEREQIRLNAEIASELDILEKNEASLAKEQ